MRRFSFTWWVVVLVTLTLSAPLPGQDLASEKRAEASPQRITESLRAGDFGDALEYYRALVNKTGDIHLLSLRELCLKVIREALDEESVDVRIQAGRALSHTVDRQSLDLVLEVVQEQLLPEEFYINEPLVPVRPEGLLPRIKPLVDHKDRMVRVWAVHSLSSIGGPEVVEPLTKALDDQFFWARSQAIVALGKLGPNLAPKAELRPLVDDPSPLVALVAAEVLLALGDAGMAGRVETMLDIPDPHLASYFSLVAQALGSEATVPVLLKLLAHQSGQVRAKAALTLGHLGVTEAFEPLMELLRDREIPVRAAAATALGDLGDPRASGELVRLASTSTGPLKLAAVSALGKFESPAVLVTLRRALLDDNSDVRLAAAQALGHIRHKDVIPLLRTVYEDRDEGIAVRVNAAVSAARLDDSAAVVQLNSEAQAQEDAHTRLWAAWGLGEVGGRGQLFTLVSLLSDSDTMVPPVAAGALLKLSNRLEEAAAQTSR